MMIALALTLAGLALNAPLCAQGVRSDSGLEGPVIQARRELIQVRITAKALEKLPMAAKLAVERTGGGHDVFQDQKGDMLFMRRKISLTPVGEAKFMLIDAQEELSAFGPEPSVNNPDRLARYIDLASDFLATLMFLQKNNVIDLEPCEGQDYKIDVYWERADPPTIIPNPYGP